MGVELKPPVGKNKVTVAPNTVLGRWAVGLAVANVVGMLAWSILPGGGWMGLAAGFAGGVAALVALIRRHDRAVLVYVAVLPLVAVVAFLAAELFIGHE